MYEFYFFVDLFKTCLYTDVIVKLLNGASMAFAILLRAFILVWLLGVITFLVVKLPEIIKGSSSKPVNWLVIFLFPFLLFTEKGREQIKNEFK